MRIEARLFEILTGFFGLAAIAYGSLTAAFATGGLEWTGTTALVLTAGLSVIIGTFFRFIADRPGILDSRGGCRPVAAVADRRRRGLRSGGGIGPGFRVLRRAREALSDLAAEGHDPGGNRP